MRTCNCKNHLISSTGRCPNCGGVPADPEGDALLDKMFGNSLVRSEFVQTQNRIAELETMLKSAKRGEELARGEETHLREVLVSSNRIRSELHDRIGDLETDLVRTAALVPSEGYVVINEAELAGLRKDKERLDWINKKYNYHGIHISGDQGESFEVVVGLDTGRDRRVFSGEDIREAIDETVAIALLAKDGQP